MVVYCRQKNRVARTSSWYSSWFFTRGECRNPGVARHAEDSPSSVMAPASTSSAPMDAYRSHCTACCTKMPAVSRSAEILHNAKEDAAAHAHGAGQIPESEP